jgi:hypothetical protein
MCDVFPLLRYLFNIYRIIKLVQRCMMCFHLCCDVFPLLYVCDVFIIVLFSYFLVHFFELSLISMPVINKVDGLVP